MPILMCLAQRYVLAYIYLAIGVIATDFFTMIDGHNSGREITVSRWKRRLFLAAGVNNKEVSTLLESA